MNITKRGNVNGRGRPWRVLALLGLTALAVGCTRPAKLEPAAAAKKAAGTDAASAQTAGVRLVADSDAWQGLPGVKEHVTPLWVRIENNSGEPLRLRLREMALVDDDGERYQALPLYAIDGSVQEPVLIHYGPVEHPDVELNGFYVAPIYSPIYPGVPMYTGAFTYDVDYYHHTHRYWAKLDLPTDRMRALALPEGVLEDGGVASGYLFFEVVDPREPRYRLEARLIDAGSGSTMGKLTIPFKNSRVASR